MMRFLTAIILIALSIAGFMFFTQPLLADIDTLKAEASQYDQALENAKSLENEKDKLTQKYNNISPENLTKLEKLLPDNVDNIRLILEIGKIALPYGMILKNVKYDALPKPGATNEVVSARAEPQEALKDYGNWNLEFSTAGTYNNFIPFLKDLESNLRIIDIASIDFASDVVGQNSASNQVYNYGFKIKTYWLKD